jgi:Cdc6-like AAA superfamily ATPase
MAEPSANPYRSDLPGVGPFYGRDAEIEGLVTALRNGRRALAAVMGGRGMGKTTLALRVKEKLSGIEGTIVHAVALPRREPAQFLAQLESHLGLPLDPLSPGDSIVDAVRATDGDRVVLLLDEIDGLVAAEGGRDLLENLRVAYEALAGKLGIVVFGGSSLRELLTSDVSPFLRTAQ